MMDLGRMLACVAACGLVAAPATTRGAPKREGPPQVVPEKKKGKQRRIERRRARKDRKHQDLSQGGRKQGVLELTLGSLAIALSGVLIGRGIWEVVKADEVVQKCEENPDFDPILCGSNDPTIGNKIAAGLSFSFAVPIAVAGGLLMARGLHINRDYRKWKASRKAELRVSPLGLRRGGGLGLTLRF